MIEVPQFGISNACYSSLHSIAQGKAHAYCPLSGVSPNHKQITLSLDTE